MAREQLKVKLFKEYTKDEQIELMFHWFYYYGKSPVSFAEMDRFKKLMDEDMDFVKRAALVAWAREEMPQSLVNALRGDFEKYREEIINVSTTLEFEDYEDRLEKELIAELVSTYNNPKPSVPMSDDQIMDEVCRMFGIDDSNVQVLKVSAKDILEEDSDILLTSERVHEVYRECLLKDEELVDGEPGVDFTVGEGIMRTVVFNSERLGKNKDTIISMIDQLDGIDEVSSFMRFCMDKNGRQWTGEHATMDELMQLGVAADVIQYALPRELWPVVGGVPFVARIHEKDNEELRSHKPKEFKKVRDDLSKGIYRRDAK